MSGGPRCCVDSDHRDNPHMIVQMANDMAESERTRLARNSNRGISWREAHRSVDR